MPEDRVYPPNEFCETNCKNPDIYKDLINYQERNKIFLEISNERGKRFYQYKLQLLRRALGCSDCAEAIKWELSDIAKGFQLPDFLR